MKIIKANERNLMRLTKAELLKLAKQINLDSYISMLEKETKEYIVRTILANI